MSKVSAKHAPTDKAARLLGFRKWLPKTRCGKIQLSIVLTALVLLGGMYGIARWYIWQEGNKPVVMGVSFIPDYATYLGVDPQQTMDALIKDVGVRHFRLTSYWSD